MELEESDRFMECGFCRVRLSIASGDFMRYHICPSGKVPAEDLIYAPYWHYKGMRFTVKPYEVRSKIVDISFSATSRDYFPSNLGFRPQSIQLKFAPPTLAGSFIKKDIAYSGVQEKLGVITITNDALADMGKFFHRTYVGDTTSLIYAPYYIKGRGLFDAVTDKPIAGADFKRIEELSKAGAMRKWRLRFIPAQCPTCGWDMEGHHDSVVLICRNCDSAWKSSLGGMKPIPFAMVHMKNPEAYYIPFWRIKARVKGVTASSYADLVRLANLPKVVRATWEDEELYFWFPATRLSPRAFGRLSKYVTLKRPGMLFKGRTSERFKRAKLATVNLEAQEAAENILVLIADLAMRKKDIMPTLSDATVKAMGKQLYFFPFVRKGTDYVQPDMGFAVPVNSFRSLRG